MTLRLRAFAAVPPSLLRPFVVRRLLHRTADAFGVRRPPMRARASGMDLLFAYATFSNTRAELLLAGHGDIHAARRELWRIAERIGRGLRRGLGITTVADAMVAARAVYRALDIDLRGSPTGEVVVARCSFAGIYGPEVCAVMSSLDAGLFAGLTGGQRLAFTRRITEGAPACLATLAPTAVRAT
ncbi:MAG TPA: hypothetical protein VF082_03745 [Jiangellaceae bacterium]